MIYGKTPSELESCTSEESTFLREVPNCQSEESELKKIEPPIDNHNFRDEDVRLLDVSSSKEWMAYVSHKREEIENNPRKKVYTTYLTRRRFTAVDLNTRKKVALKKGLQVASFDLEHYSVDITSLMKTAGLNHCRFLSISRDGMYIALSLFVEKQKDFKDTRCFIFKVNNKSIKLKSSPKFFGRAVFLNEKKKMPLALIDEKTLKYANNLPGLSDKNTLDLNIFDSGVTPELPLFHDTYIQNSPWLDFKGESNPTKKLITFTRHIKHNIITTPFSSTGIVRTWSIKENGVRLTSFEAVGQHIMAFSKDYKFTAAYVEKNRSINVYNVKSGLLVYQLKSQKVDPTVKFEVSHIRFCYGGRYVAMSGWVENKVVFEIWYLEAEKSIYRKSQNVGTRSYYSSDNSNLKVFEPFVTRSYNINGEKCLMGFYMFNNSNQLETKCMELNIDTEEATAGIDWIISNTSPAYDAKYEISNDLSAFEGLKCGYIHIGEMKYLIRFGKHTIQLWNVGGNSDKKHSIHEDELIYIRAYKPPAYGPDHSFREAWKICNFDSIKFVGDNPWRRLLVNIRDTSNDNSGNEIISKIYHTEEIFLPLDEVNNGRNFDYHKLESACQALHYFFSDIENEIKRHPNMTELRIKTLKLIESAIDNIDDESNYFSTLSGSKTLAMLASFKEGREVIKSILIKNVPISIFSFHRPLDKTFRLLEEDMKSALDYWKNKKSNMDNRYLKLKQKFGYSIESEDPSEDAIEENMIKNDVIGNKITYRSSSKEIISTEKCEKMATNENALTILIEESSYKLFKLLFNRILLDSKKLGPGCLSALTDALVFLQEQGNSDLLLSSSQKLSYLRIGLDKLGILNSELSSTIKIESPQKEYVANLRKLESHAIKEQLTKYGGLESLLREYRDKLYSECAHRFYIKRIYKFLHNIVLIIRYLIWEYITKDSQESKKELSNLCVIPLPHFNSYSDFPEDRIKGGKKTKKSKKSEESGNNKNNEDYEDYENNEDIIPYKNESAFTRIASNQHDNNIFRQGDTILEVLLEYKWRMFARKKFIFICLIHVLYYVSYSTGVLFSRTLFVKEDSEEFDMSHGGHIASLTIMGLSLSLLVIQETRQFFKSYSKMAYIMSGYNWVDMFAFGFPVLTVLQSLLGWNYFNEVCSVTTLILWLHGILRLRVIMSFGVTLEIIIELFKNVSSVLFIMLLVVIAFTQAFIVLLRTEEDEYFRDNFAGDFTSNTTLPAGNVTTEGLTNSFNVSADNGFKNWFKAFSQVWFFIYGVWDPVIEGEAGDSKMLMAMCILFSFITVLIFFNMVIALMSSTVEDVKKRGKKVWVSHFAAVVSEIELLWCSEKEKHSRINNPTYIYYIANSETISAKEKELDDETNQLLQDLGIDSTNNNLHN